MSDLKEVSIHITVKSVDIAPPRRRSPPSPDENPQCDLWSFCNDPLCFRAGCRNVFTNHDKGGES